jgi:hypothetical protein
MKKPSGGSWRPEGLDSLFPIPYGLGLAVLGSPPPDGREPPLELEVPALLDPPLDELPPDELPRGPPPSRRV